MALRSLQKVRGKDELALHADEQESTSEAETEAQAAPFNPFDLLSDDEGPGAQIDEQDSDEAPEAQPASQPVPAAAASKGAGRRAKKKGKKASKGTASAAAKDAQQAPAEEDDIDAQLKALGLAPGDGSGGPSDANGRQASTSQAAVAGSLAELLAVDLVKAKPQHEMRRIFGSRIVDAEARQARGGAGVGQSRRVRRLMARGLIRREHLKRGTLIEPRDHWPPFTGGLSMEPDGNATDGAECWKYVFSGAYQGYQNLFEQSQATMDPNNIAALLHEYPYHVDALLAMHELYRATGEHASSDEMLERCLYALDLAFHPRFVLGRSRMSHGPVRNRPLFAALFKQMQNLSRRGLHATALEYAKLLLSLDPEGDPRGVLCCIEYLALRAQRPEFLLELAAAYKGPVDLQMLPSGAFSLPLARHRQQHGYSPQLDSRMGGGSGFEASPQVHSPQLGSPLEGLSVAVMMFPAAVVMLTDKLKDKGVGRDGEWGSLLGKPPLLRASAEDSATLSHLLSLFVERHWLLWKAPDAQRLLKDACHVATLAPREERDNWARAAQEQYPEGEGNEYSHLRVADFSDEASALPPEELQAAMGGAQGVPAEEDLEMLVAQMQGGLARREAGGHQMTDEQMAATNPLMQLLRTMLPFVNEGQVPDYEGDDQARDQANQQQPQEPPDLE